MNVRFSVILILLVLLAPAVASSGIVRPLDGDGAFHTFFDVLNRWQDDGSLDVLVLVEISNADIKYTESDNSFIGKFKFEVFLEGPDGLVITKKRHMSTAVLDNVLAASRTSSQVFGVVLKDVPFREGRLTCRVLDDVAKKSGYSRSLTLHSSESVTDWSAEHEVRGTGGITVGDPLFLAQAPLNTWNPSDDGKAATTGYLYDFIHPSRRYGLVQDKLQLFIPVWPSQGVGEKPDEHAGLQVQIVSSDMIYSITDTLQFDNLGIASLEKGKSAGIIYELDINILPEGSCQMSIAPLNRRGKGQLVMFDVVWRLNALGRHRDDVLGEGRLVLSGKELDTFLAESPAGQEKILADFWTSLNPEPENPINSVYMEFLSRKTYVRTFLGGFGPLGANDPRGEVYLLIGPPDEIEREGIPMNSSDLDDAQIKTFQRFAPDREGSWAKGEDVNERAARFGTEYTGAGGIPMPRSYNGEKQIAQTQNSSFGSNSFELWIYDLGGKPLFLNHLDEKGKWQRFLFIDRTGAGDYYLASSNTLQGDD